MVAEAQFNRDSGEIEGTSTAVYAAGEIIQLADGRCGIKQGLKNNVSGDKVDFAVVGLYYIKKSTSVVFLPGQEVWWDPTNNVATYRLAAEANAGFIVGLCANEDTVAAATTQVLVDVNRQRPANLIDQYFSGWVFANNGTPLLATMSHEEGGEFRMILDATSEAQRADALSANSIAVAGKGIAEFEVNLVTAAGSATDFSVGLANATHASDADAITEHVFFHMDGADTKIYAQSKDGTTTVAATDTTKVYATGTRFFVQIDWRVPGGVKLYVNGVRVLSATVFDLSHAAGPMKLLAHVEKTSGTNTAEMRIRNARAYRLLGA